MGEIGFHASHEQIPPGQLLRDVQHAESAGFTAAMCSDHFSPWSRVQGHSGFAWSWLGAALESTRLPFGVVTSAGHRYHPAILAQASATLASMYPERVWVALGSGEHLNEHVAGHAWPPKEERQQHLEQNYRILRDLYAGGRVTETVGPTIVHDARIWDRPEVAPPLIIPALTPTTAARFAGVADGIITVNQPVDALKTLLAAYRDHGGTGPAMIQVHLSWAEDESVAERVAVEQWRSNAFDPQTMADLRTPEAFEATAAAENITAADLTDAVNMSADLGRHTAWLQAYQELGFEHLFLHHVGTRQRAFIDAFGEHVIPHLT